jgi:hypothetical protein
MPSNAPTELARRVAELTAVPMDDELLGRVICAVLGMPFAAVEISCGDDGSDELTVWSGESEDDDCTCRAWSDYRSRAPDVSLDAALALVERVRPGCAWAVVNKNRYGHPEAEIWWDAPGNWSGKCSAATPALAILSALFASLPTDGGGDA